MRKPSSFEGGAPSNVLDLLGDPASSGERLRPLMAMRTEHAGMVAAAGLFNGAVIDGKVIRGSTVKRTIERVEQRTTEGGSEVTETIEAEVLAAQLSILDMQHAEVRVINSLDQKQEFESLLLGYAQDFVDLAFRLYPPTFTASDVERYRPALEQVKAPRALAGRANGLFEPQLVRAGAILDGWRRHNVITLVGEMGTGKTAISVAAAAVKALQRKAHNQKVVVLLPPKDDLVKKWAEEIKTSLREIVQPDGSRGPQVVAAQTISDVQAAFAQPGLGFILLKETTAKMSSGWAKVPTLRRKTKHGQVAVCPTCGQQIAYAAGGSTIEDPHTRKAHCRALRHADVDAYTPHQRRRDASRNTSGRARARAVACIRPSWMDGPGSRRQRMTTAHTATAQMRNGAGVGMTSTAKDAHTAAMRARSKS